MRTLSTVVSVLGLGLLAACGSDATSVSESVVITEAPADQGDASTDATGSPAEKPEATSGAPASVAKSGFTTYEVVDETWANVGALVQSNTDEDIFFVEVTYNFIGADGTPVATESSFIDVLPAGETVATSSSTTVDLAAFMPVSLEVTAFVDHDASFFENEWAELDVAVASSTVVSDEFGFGTFSGTITNTTDVVADFYTIGCVVLAPDGTMIGGITAFGETAAPGQTVAWEASGISDFEAFADAGGSLSNCRTIIQVG